MNDSNETIVKVNCSKFLTFEGEKPIIAVNKDRLTLIPNLIIIGFVALFFQALVTVSYFYLNSMLLLITGSLAVMLLGVVSIVHALIDSFFHIYIVTNRKILEIKLVPFVGKFRSEILLDQVKCTELDMQSDGFIFNLFDVGTVMMTFDRPIHQHELTMTKIKNYRKIGQILSQLIVNYTNPQPQNPQKEIKEVWYKTEDGVPKTNFFEEITHPPPK